MSVSQHIESVLHKDIFTAIKESVGLNDDLAEAAAANLLRQLQVNWGGREVYIPVLKSDDRDNGIKRDFNGGNHGTLYRVTK